VRIDASTRTPTKYLGSYDEKEKKKTWVFYAFCEGEAATGKRGTEDTIRCGGLRVHPGEQILLEG